MANTLKRINFFPNRHDLELLSENRIGSPSHNIIHIIHINYLRAQLERIATAIK
jgi:hypothetical protein